MAIEEEFAIEIPDAEADAINSVDQGGYSAALQRWRPKRREALAILVGHVQTDASASRAHSCLYGLC
jgi:hypothetical protein